MVGATCKPSFVRMVPPLQAGNRVRRSCSPMGPSWATISLAALLLARSGHWGSARAESVPEHPTRPHMAGPAGDCLGLHATGFAVPFLSPERRCALTAPFHPCLCGHRLGEPICPPSAVCSLLHYPSPATTSAHVGSESRSTRSCSGGWALPTVVALSCSDFPHMPLNKRACAAASLRIPRLYRHSHVKSGDSPHHRWGCFPRMPSLTALPGGGIPGLFAQPRTGRRT